MGEIELVHHLKESSAAEKFIEKQKDLIETEHKDSLKKLYECRHLIRLALEVKVSWEDPLKGRDAIIEFNFQYNWPENGLKLQLDLGEDDSVRTVSSYLKPLKYSSDLIYIEPTVDKQNGIVGANYRAAKSLRILELRIVVAKSRSCKQVKVGEKTVPVYEVKCDGPEELVELPEISADTFMLTEEADNGG